MTLRQIAEMSGEGESATKAHRILVRVKSWLKRGVPNSVILELIAEMDGDYTPFQVDQQDVLNELLAGKLGGTL